MLFKEREVSAERAPLLGLTHCDWGDASVTGVVSVNVLDRSRLHCVWRQVIMRYQGYSYHRLSVLVFVVLLVRSSAGGGSSYLVVGNCGWKAAEVVE